MKSKRINSTAIKSLLLAILLVCFCSAIVFAGQEVGTVTHLSGPLLAKKNDGTTRILTRSAPVEEGDTLVTEKRTYARIKFKDESDVTLKPGTQFKVDKFSFDEKNPKDDSAVMNLVKGGLRTVTGKVGKRGNQDAYEMKTPTATIGVRGTSYGADFCQPGTCGQLPKGLYVSVLAGTIELSNAAGKQQFLQNQSGFVASTNVPPIVLPKRPDIPFTPPPSITAPSTSGQKDGAAGAGSAKPVDCEVR
jgi:hypothetical protein